MIYISRQRMACCAQLGSPIVQACKSQWFHAMAVASDTCSIVCHRLLLTCAGLRWAIPRMQHPRTLRAHFDAADALEFLTTQARSSGPPDLSSLLELQL